MGACSFRTYSSGSSAQKAFDSAVENEQYMNGHGGYTGTIAEKHNFKVVSPKGGETPEQCVNRHDDLDTFGNKWGPAGCVKIEDGKYCFFGWASS